MAATEYNLTMGQDMGSPYVAPGEGSILPGHTRLQLMYHHTVPRNRLRDFWNATAGNRAIRKRPFLLAISDNIGHYVDMISPVGRLRDEDVKAAAKLSREISRGNIVHGPDAKDRPDGWDDFRRVYMWLPGNLFKGPKNRADDRGAEFDEPARHIFRTGHFALLSRVNENMSRYLAGSGDVSLADSVYADLGEVASTSYRFRQFNAKHWTWNDAENKPEIANRQEGA